ncbi:hypothetical protein, partial [Bifidobacterium bifidum]|uniref:hypothetical protein n=1 Tax=Bifidobacterium bifidum TaxID=1681 RepID=UPI001957EC78
MTLTTQGYPHLIVACVSDACQINDFDHANIVQLFGTRVSDACQINDFDHRTSLRRNPSSVSDACQIN